jgi:hypothetical protein
VTSSDARHQQLHLIGLVCFYGGTMEVFFSYDHQTCQWHFCFDGHVLVCVDWDAVRRKCIDFHLQPFLLIYANPTRNPLDISQLLKQTVIQAKQTNRKSNFDVFFFDQPKTCKSLLDVFDRICSLSRHYLIASQPFSAVLSTQSVEYAWPGDYFGFY